VLLSSPGHSAPQAVSVHAARRLSFLARAVVAGFGQAGHIESDRITAFVASGGKEITNNTGQGQKETPHGLLPVGFCLAREKLPRQSSKPKRRHRPSSAGCVPAPVTQHRGEWAPLQPFAMAIDHELPWALTHCQIECAINFLARQAHAAATTSRHIYTSDALKARCVLAEVR
jgi:hypothetical protein